VNAPVSALVHKPSSEVSAASFLARYNGLRARLPGHADARERAANLLRRHGLPSTRDEAWKYTNLTSLVEAPFHEALTEVGVEGDLTKIGIPDLAMLSDAPRAVFVDGRFRPDLSKQAETVRVRCFADAGTFGSQARPETDRMVALNTMLAEDGALIDVDAGVDGGVLLLISMGADLSGTPTAFHPRHQITLAAGAALTLIEICVGHGTYLHNPVTEIKLAEGARLAHVRLQNEAAEAFHLATIYADIAERASYDGFTLTIGARVARSEIHARLAGPHAHAALNAAQVLRGTQHADFTTVVSHDAPDCASRQTVKNVLSGRSRGVFQGKIEVARAAQRTDGYQMNQALLLSPDAEIDCKPQLEIYADDVKCSHGATVGELEADQMFYLISRGIPKAEARTMLVRAFLADAVDQVAHEDARAFLDAALERWWDREPA
jgi:Fe-S cluster assembly protein SufD